MNRQRDDPFKQETSEQIKVYIRNRPLRNQFARRCLKLIDHGVALNFKDKIHQFYYDGVFDEGETQQQVFQQSCVPILQDILKGNNASLFVYGQTGTGKTYTMGTLQAIKRQDQGLIPLSMKYLLNSFESEQEKDWQIGISFMQIYLQQIYDLLNPRSGKLKIRQDHQTGQTYVQDLVVVPIRNYQQSIQLINAGLQYRKTGNQKMNEVSSRSHTILTIYVTKKISHSQYMHSTLSLIDLAGSERVKKTNSIEKRLEQAKYINSSLSALGNVISQLAANDSQRFIPYRTSKLTRILKNSLTGRSKISVICTLQISQSNLYQTYSTLLFADRCKAIRLPNQPAINIQAFQELDQEKDIRLALQKSKQKQLQYLEIIRNLQSNGRSVKETQRQTQLSNIIESIYKLFGEINDHLKKVLDPQTNHEKREVPKVTPTTSIPSIKGNIKKMAQETIDKVNNLSTIAFGQGKTNNSINNQQGQALSLLLLDFLRQNIKLQDSIYIKDGKDSLEKEIALQQYEKDKKQQILNKLKNKKLNSLVNHFEQIWSQGSASSNPLQSLLNNIRRGQVNYYGEKSSTKKAQNHDFTSPKQFLKMLTRQQSQRKHKQMLIDQGNSEEQGEERQEQEKSMSGSQIKYFQSKNSPVRSNLGQSNKKESSSKLKQSSNSNNGNEIKKLLEGLIASKSKYQEKRRRETEEM